MTARQFVQALAQARFRHVFNPYSDTSLCKVYDRHDAPRIRRRTLLRVLDAATEQRVDALWVGRDLGYCGGRRTGLAFTDDEHLDTHGARWGVPLERATKGMTVRERSASVVWDVLSQTTDNIFLWNAFPFHPHERGRPFTNRSHNARERQAGERVLGDLIDLLQPRQIIAIGNNAFDLVQQMEYAIPVRKVRHPSYGGHLEFRRQVIRSLGG